MDSALSEAGVRRAVFEWWAPRLHRIADWVARAGDRPAQPPRAGRTSPAKITGRLGAAASRLRAARPGRPDRAPRRRHASPSSTTRPARRPGRPRSRPGFAPQLPLEAAMALAGAFGRDLAGRDRRTDLLAPDRRLRSRRGADAVRRRSGADRRGRRQRARPSLRALIAAFDDPARAYLRASRIPAARRASPTTPSLPGVAEWDVAGDEAMTRSRPRRAPRPSSCVASDPAVSAFVAASAGSGKTKLLTDRLLRLMLTGADPARIQCLTFTKAAAAEMALRLQAHPRRTG